MAKKDFTEYERDLKDFQKNPLKPKGKDFNIFPPEIDIKESENQDPSVLPASKLSMRKKATIELHQTSQDAQKRVEELSEEIIGPLMVVVPIKYAESDRYKVGMRGFDFEAIPGQIYYIIADSVDEVKSWGLASEIVEGSSEVQSKKKTFPKKLAVSDTVVQRMLDKINRGISDLARWDQGESDLDVDKLAKRLSRWIEEAENIFESSLSPQQRVKFRSILDRYKEEFSDLLGGRDYEAFRIRNKKLAVGDEFVTSEGTPAKVVDVAPDLVIWVAVDGDDFGSELVEDIEEGGPPYGHGFGPREHEPLHTEIELEEINE